jgi:thiol-disulfide isomerase/thioredoxin
MPKWDAVTISAVVGAAVVVIVVMVLLLVRNRSSVHGLRSAEPAGKSAAAAHPVSGAELAVIKATWCGACNALMPTVKKLQQDGVAVKLIEGPTMGEQWQRQNGVVAYPTICMLDPVTNRVVAKLTGRDRSAQAIRSFAESYGSQRK